MLGLLASCWVAGTLWIRSREPVLVATLPPSAPGRTIRVGPRSVRILERGTGPPLLLVAGTGGSAAIWPESVLQRLSRRHHVVAVDLFGMGFSDRSSEFTYGFALWSRQLAGVLDSLQLERASVLGHSLGGTVAIFFAANHPERVDRVILASSAVSIPWWFPVLLMPGPGELLLAADEVFGPTFSPRHREEAVAAYRIRGSRDALLRYVRHSPFEARSLYPALDSIRAEVLQLHGVSDEEVSFSAAERLHERLRGSRLVPIEEAGHFVMVDAPETFAAEVEAFLANDATAPRARQASGPP